MTKIENTFLKVGDTVSVRGSWLKDPVREVQVTALEVTKYPGEKIPHLSVQSVEWGQVRANRVLVSYTLGPDDSDHRRWAFGLQVSPAGTCPLEWHKPALPIAMTFTMDWGANGYDDEGNEIPGSHTTYLVCHPKWDEEEEYWKPNIQQSIEEFLTEEEAKASIAKMEASHV